ncbi:Uma2 family endonuclease [soil metagenome]
MSQPVRPAPPSRADLDALPANVKGEIIDGVLYAMTRPRPKHQAIGARITSSLEPPFTLGKGGPGGWWILPEPGIELPRSPEVAPDIAGWRRERLAALPDGPVTLVPDWVCEVLSPTTRRHNLLVKVPYYASVGVPFLWLVDLDARALLVSKLVGEHWTDLQRFGDQRAARVEPFADIELDIAEWWSLLEAETR